MYQNVIIHFAICHKSPTIAWKMSKRAVVAKNKGALVTILFNFSTRKIIKTGKPKRKPDFWRKKKDPPDRPLPKKRPC